MALQNPCYDFPYRVDATGRPVEVERNSADELANCVQVALLTRPGDVDELPDYGTDDLTHRELPVSMTRLVEQVERYEPRVALLAEQDVADAVDGVLSVRVDVAGGTDG